MTVFIEVSRPWHWKPGRYHARAMTRYWWLCIAIGWLHIPFKEFCETSFDWKVQ